ncbi:ATP-dependent acyl-CoA ligase [Pseudomonas cavernae]|uniref:ATP-dependent acyl-CoA ligase n=1 Tax=Pseudomonas cavernae TaxID=2320867 RepID=A0A385Z2P7_9PSED|nr:AMP-binding protein [Pseudomonas cavernae]AYC31852.1 ATP-dependent acyl-CoA ligase [Pseudomonas cavernae]
MSAHQPCNPFAGQDFNWLLETQAQANARKPLLIWEPFDRPAETYSYAQFDHAVGRVAAALEALGVRSGDRVLIHLENCPEFLLTWAACGELGAIAVNTNTRSSAEEMHYFVTHSDCRVAISQPSLIASLARVRDKLRWLACTAHNAGEPAELPSGVVPYAELLAPEPAAQRRRVAADPLRPMYVQYTSGTTSRPKGVVLTHGNALWAARVNAYHQDLRSDDIHLAVMPLFHTNALGYSFLTSLWVGGTLVLQPRFSASRFWDVAVRNRCTWHSAVPFFMRALLAQPKPERHYFRLWGTAMCDPALAQPFGIKTIGWWGMTETISHPIIGLTGLPNTEMSIGRAASTYQICVVDDDGQPVEVGASGHLRVLGLRGVSLFKEYLDDPAATAASFDAQGWFLSGDRVTLLEDGSIKFADRDKDMLKVGGENVAASEIERVLLGVPGVVEVAVVAQRHAMLDEVPYAFVAVASEIDADRHDEFIERLFAQCRSQLADFKVPAGIRIVDDFPRVTLEKIAKAELRKQLAAEAAIR